MHDFVKFAVVPGTCVATLMSKKDRGWPGKDVMRLNLPNRFTIFVTKDGEDESLLDEVFELNVKEKVTFSDGVSIYLVSIDLR